MVHGRRCCTTALLLAAGTSAVVFERERENPRVSGERACCIEAMRQSGSTNPGASAMRLALLLLRVPRDTGSATPEARLLPVRVPQPNLP